MISDKKNILQLVALLHEHGVEDVVLCPGSRNAPIVHTLVESGLFHCHPLTDERSAGFFALGQSLATGKKVAVCVTSGSALANLYPAAAEAFYQHVPLVFISADRPAAWIGQMDGQTMPQEGALGKMVRMSVNLPEGNTPEEEWHINRLVNEALLECSHREGGPVHINVPIGEPFYEFQTEALPTVRVIRRVERFSPILLPREGKCMVLLGQRPKEEGFSSLLSVVGQRFVCLCEHLANVGQSEAVLSNPDGLLQAIPEGEEELFAPDLLITMGGHVVSKALKQFLRKHPPRQHWHVSERGEVADTYQCLTAVVEAHPSEVLKGLAELAVEEDQKAYLSMWKQLKEHVDETPHSEQERLVASFVEQLNRLPKAVLHLANSTAVRMVQRFPLSPNITVCCNRGINGIEGSLSAAVGFASAAEDCPHFVLIGDLSFFYDQNALWNMALPHNLHLMLLNSGGGQIFDTLPIPRNPQSRDCICASQHYSAANICAQYGVEYHRVSAREEWERVLPHFFASKGNILMEIEV